MTSSKPPEHVAEAQVLELAGLETECQECNGDGSIEVYRTMSTHGLDAYDGAGNDIADYPNCEHCQGTGKVPLIPGLRRECLCIEAVKTIAHGGESGYSIVCNRCALNIEHGGWCNCQGRGYNLPPDTELTGVLMEILGVDYSVTVWSLKGEWFVSLGGTFPFYRGPTLNHALAQAALPQN